MQRAYAVTTALVCLVVASSATQAQGRGRGRGRGQQGGEVVATEEQKRRIAEEQKRNEDYQRHLNDQIRAQQQREANLQSQRRAAQLQAQREYAAQLARQQEALRAQRDYQRDAYITSPQIYRYRVSGANRQTNQYGADLLRQAVNDGYQQGYRAGDADRQDHWRADYTRSPAYQEATYGYTGRYVDQPDYMYYFRQGFQRGYNDGYYSRTQYGSYTNGSHSILGNILNGILGLTRIP